MMNKSIKELEYLIKKTKLENAKTKLNIAKKISIKEELETKK